ncbi:hypothetical protein EW026_g4932 [Hermanssonia centrifuga]|uniref:Uncharacterized protein n=1 Tax=Hermanssonia centrifuga TaxID=98765 RepID=A0A4S4KFQ0_9APHY|nr:hypothetical protein EW026_g4932 [Hermanssonia centrifuga]
MREYVYALHDFTPQIADEIAFKAGDAIEVIEKDDLYQDGWWQGRNPDGKIAVAFPDSPHVPSAALHTLSEEADSLGGTSATYTPPNGATDERERTLSHGEVTMQATLTDVQKAIEQLGRSNDADGSRSFSFRSSHGDYTDHSEVGTDADDTDADEASGTEWHKSARQRLAERAQQENEQRLAREAAESMPSTPIRVTAPPIDVEMSDESEDEDEADDDGAAHMQRRLSGDPPDSHFRTQYPHIPEEDETTEDIAVVPKSPTVARMTTESATLVPQVQTATTATFPFSHSVTTPGSDTGHIVPSEDFIVPSPGITEEDLPTATADRLTFPEVPFTASPDPSPLLSAYSGSTEPSPMPPPAPPPIAVVQPPVAHAPSPPPVLPSSPPASVTGPSSRQPSPPVVNIISSPSPPTSSALPEESESTPIPPAAPAPSFRSSAPSASTVRAAPTAIKINEPLPSTARTGAPSPGFPLPSPTASSNGSVGFNSGIQQTLTPATTVMSFRTAGLSTPQQESSPQSGSPDGVKRPANHPSEWTVEEVVDWLRSKGFDQSVCDRFIEQEITGDVLLELDANILKSELGIIAFGKRVRIVNAITELRRPPSFSESEHPMPALTSSQSFNYGHSHTSSMQSSAHHSYNNSPLAYTGPSFSPSASSRALSNTSGNMGSAGFSSFGGAESPMYMPTADTSANPGAFPKTEWRSSDPGAVPHAQATYSQASFGTARAEDVPSEPIAVIAPLPQPSSLIGLGIGLPGTAPNTRPGSPASKASKTRPAHLVLASAAQDSKVTAVGDDQPPTDSAAEEHVVMSEGEATQQDPKSKRRRLFGRSSESTSLKEKASSLKASSLKDLRETSSHHSKEATPITASDSGKPEGSEPVSPPRRHSKKKSHDDRKASDRLSLFGSSFTGSIAKKTRKPVPKLSSEKGEKVDKATDKTEKPEKEKSEHDWSALSTFSRMRHHSERKPSGRPSTSDGSVKEKEKAKSVEAQDRRSSSPKEKPRDPALLRKRTTSIPDPAVRSPSFASAAAGGVSLKPGKSILEQIGTPDHNGWMRKRGDRYNSWKLRYFVLKGSHLYCLRSNDRSETKIKGYVNIVGYKVVADENIDPGRYGFRIVHDSDKTHYFSHDEQIVIREWMKALMKATISRDFTNPVVSSSNIPTIPLTVAQAMNPSPRPPSPTARAATQRAHRREDPNKLSSRDAEILLMGVPAKEKSANGKHDSERARVESFFTNDTVSVKSSGPMSPKKSTSSPPKTSAPPRPSREPRRKFSNAPGPVDEDALIEWANAHLPESLHIKGTATPLCGGLALLRLAEDIKGKPSSPPVPDSAFPSGPNDDKLDGLFRLFDFLLDNDIKMGAVSVNDIRQGNKEKVLQLLQALRVWEDKRKAIALSIGQNSLVGTGSINFMAGPVSNF